MRHEFFGQLNFPFLLVFAVFNKLRWIWIFSRSKVDCIEAIWVLFLAIQSVFNSHCTIEVESFACDAVFFVESDWIEEDVDNLFRVCVKRDVNYRFLTLQMMNSCSPLLWVRNFVIHQFGSVLPHITVVPLKSMCQSVLLGVFLLFLSSQVENYLFSSLRIIGPNVNLRTTLLQVIWETEDVGNILFPVLELRNDLINVSLWEENVIFSARTFLKNKFLLLWLTYNVVYR